MEIEINENIKVNIEDIIRITSIAANEIMKIYYTNVEIWNSSFLGDESPLSLAQAISTTIIYQELNQRYPGIPISSESKIADYYDRREYEYFFCISPLDGYKEFVRRNGQFSVNIGLCYRSYPLLGVVYIPCPAFKDLPRVYYALDRQGAFVRYIQPYNYNELSNESKIIDETPRRLECKEFFETDENLRIVMSSLAPVSPVRSALSSGEMTPEIFLSKYKNPIIISTTGPNILQRSDSGITSSTTTLSTTNSTPTSPKKTTPSKIPNNLINKPSLNIPNYTLSNQVGSSSIIFNILLIVEQKADCYPKLAVTCEWNTCAIHAILNEAGGEIIQLPGGMEPCTPGNQLEYNKPHPINPFFVAYGKRLIPTDALFDEMIAKSTDQRHSQFYTILAIQEKQKELKKLLDLQDLQYEQQYQQSLLQQQEQQQGQEEQQGQEGQEGEQEQEGKEGENNKKENDEKNDQENHESNNENLKEKINIDEKDIKNKKESKKKQIIIIEEEEEKEKKIIIQDQEIEEDEIINSNQPQTLSLGLGLLGILIGVIVCSFAILYQLQNRPINSK